MTPAAPALQFDEHGVASLDGTWEFYPGDHQLTALADLEPESIVVPGLWEAQGHLELDGIAWYRRTIHLDDTSGHWTLRFGAVMDLAEVYVNGTLLVSNELPFTPFDTDPGGVLRVGANEIAVRVNDPRLDDPEHIRTPHGKQGWANHVFPSRPSLYMTYGGIWQSVTLRRHGPVVVRDLFLDADPDHLLARVELDNRRRSTMAVRLAVRAVGLVREVVVHVPPGDGHVFEVALGASRARRWSPESPVLHDAWVDVLVDGELSDARRVRFGLRTIRVDGDRLLVNDLPYRMKSVLVQGFRADGLYAEGSRAQIVEEVLAAKAMGFNTLRLHIKAFHPTYLDVCDELGVYLHCDIPVAEPIAHEELGDGTVVSRRSAAAVREQIRRDRNHPSIIVWAVMNELGLDREGVRGWDVYEQFARTLVAAAVAVDPTRPVIENDWVEPDPDRVFATPILTAHWYGRLHADYLEKIENACLRWAGQGRPLYVSEFGDWGLPQMPALEDPPFWDTRELYRVGLAGTRWPATISRFVAETQRYQGLSDRLQAEVFRRHDHIGGYCLTELTDVPHELNGLLDLERRPKPLAVAEITRMNQTVLPMLHLPTLVAPAGELIRGCVHVANDGPELRDVEVEVRFGDTRSAFDGADLHEVDASELPADTVLARFGESVAVVPAESLPAYRATSLGEIAVAAPDVAGSHDLLITLRTAGEVVAANRYPVHVVKPAGPPVARVAVVGTDRLPAALRDLGVEVVDESSPDVALIVEEGALDATSGAVVSDRLRAGGSVLVLAQRPEAAEHYPVVVKLETVVTEWGSTVFHFTTDSGVLTSLPRRNLLVAEDSTINAMSAVTHIDGEAFPHEPAVIAYKPDPGSVTGTVVGLQRVGAGRLVYCQYRLSPRASEGDPAALALLADVVRWTAVPARRLAVERVQKADGRALAYYSVSDDAS